MEQWRAGRYYPQATDRTLFQRPPQVCQVADGTPDLGDETLVGDVEAAQVQDVIDGLHLLHLHHPGVGRLRSLLQNLPQVILSAVKHLQRGGDH